MFDQLSAKTTTTTTKQTVNPAVHLRVLAGQKGHDKQALLYRVTFHCDNGTTIQNKLGLQKSSTFKKTTTFCGFLAFIIHQD
jgi:hypothetical protein